MKKYQPWFGLFARLVVGGIIFAAGFLKVDELEKSQMAVRAYEILPIGIANFFGTILPFAEVAIGLLLILGAATRINALLSAALMALFIVAIAQAGLRGLTIDCGCFCGGGQVAKGETRYLQEIVRDTGIMALALYLYRYPSSKFSLDKEDTQQPQEELQEETKG